MVAIIFDFSYCSVISTENTTLSPILTPTYPWIVRKNETNVCILAKFGADFIVNNTKRSDKVLILPLNANVSNGSICEDDKQIIVLSFNDNSFRLTFMRDEDWIYVNNILFTYKTDDGNKNAEYNEIVFKTPKSFGYKCFSEQTIALSDSVTMNIKNVKLEAFRDGNYNESIDEPEQWERIGLKCQLDRITTDAWKITGIGLGVGIFVLGIVTLVAIWSARREEKRMFKIKLQRKWTLEKDESQLNNNNIKLNIIESTHQNNNNNMNQKF